MGISTISANEELKRQLMQVGSIVDTFQRQESNAVEKWLSWLVETADILTKYNYSETSELAATRAEILAARLSVAGERTNRRKFLRQRALETIRPVQQSVLQRQAQLEASVESVRKVLRPILMVAQQAGFITPAAYGGDFTLFLEQLLQQMLNHEQLAPSISSAIATIGKSDTLRILAEEIELV
ncbi:MAG: hypothetical protein KDD67_09510 [Ignavibacteriae bacterium]|nr:hypothetical protein [Ignavibacteriota bacterium]MCB9215198.1 hypothetical protein [Ignavibacteria bacterium]